MEINAQYARQAIDEALEKYPQYAVNSPKLIARPLYRGHALMLDYTDPPSREDPDAWEFQNAVVKRYKALAP